MTTTTPQIVLAPVDEIRAAVEKLRKHVKHATDSPWVTSSVWSPRATCTSAVYSHAHPAGSVDSEIVASGRIKSGYGGIREPWNAEYIALMQPALGSVLASWLERAAEQADEAMHDVADYPDSDPDEGECVEDCDACDEQQFALNIARLINDPRSTGAVAA
jgi:uncharacterized protein YuzB (UPF0349 family)